MTRKPRPPFVEALRMLGRRAYFTEELARRLRQGGHDRDEVEAALARCRALGLVDDRETARRFVEIRACDRGWGPARLRAELRARGVDEEIAAAATDLAPAEREQALEVALRRAEIRSPGSWWRGGVGRARMVSSLVRRGFDSDEARRAVDRRAAQREAQQHATDDQPGDP